MSWGQVWEQKHLISPSPDLNSTDYNFWNKPTLKACKKPNNTLEAHRYSIKQPCDEDITKNSSRILMMHSVKESKKVLQNGKKIIKSNKYFLL